MLQLLLLSERHLLVRLDQNEAVQVDDVLDAVLDLGLGDKVTSDGVREGQVVLRRHTTA